MATMPKQKKATRKIRIEEVENGFLVFVIDSTPGARDGGDRVLERRVFTNTKTLLEWVGDFMAETWPEKKAEGHCVSGHPSCPGKGVCPDWVEP